MATTACKWLYLYPAAFDALELPTLTTFMVCMALRLLLSFISDNCCLTHALLIGYTMQSIDASFDTRSLLCSLRDERAPAKYCASLCKLSLAKDFDWFMAF